MEFQQINPATDALGEGYEALADEELLSLLERAHAAQRAWGTTSFDRRSETLRRAAALLRERADDLARLMAREMGKPRAQGVAEARKCAWACEHYAEHGPAMLADEPVETEAAASYVHYVPLGVVLAVMPWNFPLWQVVRFGAPALMAGNGVLVKHAPNVPGCALALERLLHEAGAPPDLVRNVFLGVEQVAAAIDSPHVHAVTLTGSTRAGRAVAARAGAALKKCVLELGGSDAYVVLEDADVDAAVEQCVAGRVLNSGQSCIAAKRWIVVDAVREVFRTRALAALASKVVGDPLAEGTDVGPMARVDLRDQLHEQVERSVELGAKLLLGGEKPEGPGAWYPVTFLADVAPGMPAFDEELFGPVAALVPARDERHALELANRSPYGLGSAVFTADAERGERIARTGLEAGSAFVNTFVRSDPRLPFGGIKESGYGRELGTHGIREFVNAKTIYVA
jgi:succinate-semialdehyde dehydrogenase/glutarate-semialdehyde dehydrogenase